MALRTDLLRCPLALRVFRLHRQTRSPPCRIATGDGPRGNASITEHLRHTGARLFVRSGTEDRERLALGQPADERGGIARRQPDRAGRDLTQRPPRGLADDVKQYGLAPIDLLVRLRRRNL